MMTRALALAVLPFILLDSATQAAKPEESVVKVTAKLRPPNPMRPWAKGNPVEVQGTGVVIDGKRILTNAHLAQYASEIYVQAQGGGDRIEATVKGIGAEIDLALLALDDEKFFEKQPPLARADKLPKRLAAVEVYGFPIGGDDLSTTKGTVSRIEYDYHMQGLRIQVDAAVNPGNSGGPALVGGKMVGLVYSRLGQAENIGYIIPNQEIDLFLEDVKDGRFDGKLHQDRLSFQRLENAALRAKFGLERNVRGVMIRTTRDHNPAYPLQEFDVLTRVGHYDVDNEGMVQAQDELRVAFDYVLPKLAKDNRVPVQLVRAGKTLDADLPLTREDDRLMPSFRAEQLTYFMYGPLVFSPVLDDTADLYLRARPQLYRSRTPLLSRRDQRVSFAGEQLVVVTSPMFQHKITRGYGDPLGQVVSEVNQVKIKNLNHLVEVLRDAKDEYLAFRFAEEWTEVLVFKREEMLKTTEDLMSENGIPRRGSSEVMKVWEEK